MEPEDAFDWEPEDEDDYEVVRSELKKRFGAWCSERGLEIEGEGAEAPIHYKWGYLDGHLTCWTCDDLDEVYLELHPAKVIVEEDELGSVLTEARAFITFLSETGLLDPMSDRPDVLLSHLDDIDGRFRSNMADTARFSPGKRLWSTALAEGVPLDDERAVQSFMQTFNDRTYAERQTVLGRAGPGAFGRQTTGRFTPPGTKSLPKQSSTSRRRKKR
jgi:hypothetical protein